MKCKEVCLLVIFSIILSSCSTYRKSLDGPPSYSVDVSKIPDAVPKVEKLSKYGNKFGRSNMYRVLGKNYYVLGSSKNYQARGIASWYGTQFHEHRTSSGEMYNMLAMTAAHKSLPLPTYVEVKNLQNHKKIIVKVNDRGPFRQDRLIDLSYAAAKKLGMLGHGTALVEISAIDPIQYARNKRYFIPPSHQPLKTQQLNKLLAKTKTSTDTNKNKCFLQVGAFRNRLYAERLKNQLTRLIGMPIKISQLASGKPLYRVQIGPIYDKASLMRLHQKLKTMGFNSREMYV